jgi:serine/threonine-protein kinase RsbW
MKKSIRHPGSDRAKEIKIEIPSRLEELSRVEKWTQRIANTYCLPSDRLDNLAIAVTEAVANAIIHGNRQDPHKKVRIHFHLDGDYLKIEVADEGAGFDPDALSDPLLPENLMKESGRGVFILKSLMDEVHFTFHPDGSVVHMALKLRKDIS